MVYEDLLELITTTALDEDRPTPLGETRGDRLQRRNDTDLALKIVLFQHTRTDFVGLGTNDEQPVTFAQRQRTAEVAVVGGRFRTQFFHTPNHVEPRFLGRSDRRERRERVGHRGRIGVVTIEVEEAVVFTPDFAAEFRG